MAFAQAHLQGFAIPLDHKAGKLSGGQRAQVGLALALAKKPKLLILDKPVAALDPLAREDFLISLVKAVHITNGSLTVLLSSHLLGDLERVCDHLVALAAGKVQLCDYIEDIVESHRILSGPANTEVDEAAFTVIQSTLADRQRALLVRLNQPHHQETYLQVDTPTVEKIALSYMKQARAFTAQKGDNL